MHVALLFHLCNKSSFNNQFAFFIYILQSFDLQYFTINLWTSFRFSPKLLHIEALKTRLLKNKHQNTAIMKDMYAATNSEYLENNKTWHAEDSPWKTKQILKLINRNSLNPKSVVEIGCGAGEILRQMQLQMEDKTIEFSGYDIAPDAIKMAKQKANDKLHFYEENLLDKKDVHFDLELIIDVFEHVDDYIGFIRLCGEMADYKIYHIPLDMHVSGLLRGSMLRSRKKVGHIHYFSKETALATLKDAGQEVIDFFYTKCAVENTKRLRSRFANVFRIPLYAVSPDLTAHLLGGYSLIVLTK